MDTMGTASTADVPSNVVINGVEYSPEDAQSLIETGQKAREYEQKWNVKLDSVWPEYGKLSSERKTIAQERDQARQELADFQAKVKAQTETPVDVQKAKEAARSLGILLDEDVKGKYVSREDLDAWYSEKRQMEQATNELLDEGKQLEQELNGSDGRPKFKLRQVLAYAQAYSTKDHTMSLREAYDDMNSDDLAKWQETQKSALKGKSLRTLTGSGKKAPEDVRPNKDNVRELLHEALTGGGDQ